MIYSELKPYVQVIVLEMLDILVEVLGQAKRTLAAVKIGLANVIDPQLYADLILATIQASDYMDHIQKDSQADITLVEIHVLTVRLSRHRTNTLNFIEKSFQMDVLFDLIRRRVLKQLS
jgi:hypothetical protein